MRNLKTILASLTIIALQSCTSSGNSSTTPSEEDVMNEQSETNTIVTMNATARRWSESNLIIDYSITNTGTLELIVFDVGFTTTTGLDENGVVTLFQAKRDTGTTDFESAPTIAGRNLSPDQTLNGSADHRIPISIDYIAQLENVDPDTIKFCIGYGTADDLIPATLTDGTYSFNEDLDLQSLTCMILQRP